MPKFCNLESGKYEGVGKYGIPQIKPVYECKVNKWLGFNYVKTYGTKKDIDTGIHFFLYDYQFERVWKYPDRYVEVLSKFAFVLSPDFSPYGTMPKALKIYNIYRKMWCGRYWQEHGLKVIPTITWGYDKDLEFCLQGVPKHSTIAISTMGEGRWSNWSSLKSNWQYIMDILQPDTVLLYGKDLSQELSGNIVFKKLINSKVAV